MRFFDPAKLILLVFMDYACTVLSNRNSGEFRSPVWTGRKSSSPEKCEKTAAEHLVRKTCERNGVRNA